MEKQARRAQVLRHAKRIFARKGYHRTNVADIISRARIARGTFYLYFENKKDLFEELLEQVQRQTFRFFWEGADPASALAPDRRNLRTPGAEELVAEEETCRTLRQKMEQMGPVNMMALDEYKETADRHTFLEAQRKDLVESIENTQETIKEIDQISRTKFDEAFARINENFANVFTRLFHGGQAFLRLTDAENQAESGLDDDMPLLPRAGVGGERDSGPLGRDHLLDHYGHRRIGGEAPAGAVGDHSGAEQ